ncbi:MAG: AAA family ATPase [Chloroflexi bacterium]|nr:AAA family ATPase [Chloroflexota bacterium]
MARDPEIIVVDPDIDSRTDTAHMLEASDLTVIAESDYGIAAVAVAKESPPDVFLVSMEEPVARALQTIEMITSAAPQAATIVASSLADAGSVRRAMVAGARDYLIKPLKPEDVTRAVYGVLEQEERKRQQAGGELAEPTGRGMVITIFGAKGGIGKTTIATNLATALARMTNSNVVLVDMDTRFGDVAIMMDVAVEHSIADLGRRVDELDRETIKDALTSHHTGVSILPAPLHPTEWRNLTPDHITKIVNLLAQGHDYVVIDTPGTFNEIIAATLELGDIILLMTSMDIASIKDTALALEMLRAAEVSEDKVKLIINHSTSSNSLREEDVERVLEYEVTWRIPHDYHVANSNQLGIPIVIAKPYARVSRAVTEMAHALSGTPRESKGFLERFLGRAS